MIKHEEYDEGYDVLLGYTLPSVINSLCVTHDGGRLKIEINGEQVFYTTTGTRDCKVTLDNSPEPQILEIDQWYSIASAPRDGTEIAVRPDEGFDRALFKGGHWFWSTPGANCVCAGPKPVGWRPLHQAELDVSAEQSHPSTD